MKILAIRGRNLTSLEGDFEVDLQGPALLGAGVFAITGPVGAGKSTLLDALCLALFDSTPRFHQKGGVKIGREDEDEKLRLKSNDVRSVLRRGASSGFAEVDFRAIDGVVYRARWAVRRARDRADGAMQNQVMSLVERDGDRAFGGTRTEVLQEIRDRVGLSFDQFCRSVLLAQGDFARFLRADDSDRAALLERMTGTELYGRLSIAAHGRRKAARAELAAAEERIVLHPVLDDPARAELEAERDRLQRVFQGLDGAGAAVDAALRWHLETGRKRVEVADAEATLTDAEAKVAAATERHRDQGEAFTAGLRRERGSIAAARATSAERRGQVERWLEDRKHQGLLSRQWDRWAGILQRYRTSAAEVVRIAASLAKVQQEETAGRKALVAAETDREKAAAALDRAEQARAAAEAVLGAEDGEALAQQLETVETQLDAARRAERIFADLETLEANVHRAETRAVAARAAVAEAAAAVAAQTQKLAEVTARLDEVERSLREAERVKDLEAHRGELVPGHPCPLCGATDHPFAVHGLPEFAADLQARRRELRRQADESRSKVASSETEGTTQAGIAASAAAEAVAFQENAATLRGQLGAADRSRAEVGERLAAGTARRAAILVDQRRIDELRAAVKTAAKAEEAERTRWLAAKDEVAQRERALHEITPKIAEHQAAQRHVEAEARGAAAELEEVFGTDGRFDDEAGVSWQARLEHNPATFIGWCETWVLAFTRHEEEAATLSGRDAAFATLEVALDDLATEVTQSRFDAALSALAATGIEAAAALTELLQRELRRREQAGEEARRLADAVQKATAVVAERRRSRAAHEATDRPAWDEAAAAAEKVRVQAELDRIQPRRDEVRYGLRRDDEARRTLAELAPKIAALRERAGTWAKMDDLIGHHDGVKFRVFAQSLTLDRVLAGANLQLAELAPRYRIERVPGHDLDLQVVDLDMGEDVRSVNSLSGGESFLFSLALALGLSSVSAATTRVESLFIDEGFGTLDLRTLDLALATLDALQASGRQVGVISHVAGIGERIGAQVEVVPMESGRSRIRIGRRGSSGQASMDSFS